MPATSKCCRIPGCPPARPSLFWLLIGPVSHRRVGVGAWWERRAGTGGRCAAATDQTQALAAGVGGSNSKTSVAARLACVGGGRVKGTDGRAGE